MGLAGFVSGSATVPPSSLGIEIIVYSIYGLGYTHLAGLSLA